MLFGFAALVITLLLTIVSITIRDFWREPDLQWFNGGEMQVVGYVGIIGGIAVLATYIFFVVPLVLLWPALSQPKHWYAMLCVAMLWPPLFQEIIERDRPSMVFREIRRFPGLYGWPELFALCSCGCYVLLIRWQHRRLNAG